MFSFLSKSSVGNISKEYCDYFYIMALIMVISIAFSILGLMVAVYKSATDKRSGITSGTYAAFAYTLFIHSILFINYSLLFSICRKTL